MRPRTSSGRGERGSAAVEFALVLPLVLLFLLAFVQVGVLVRDRLVVSHAVRAGAREAAVTDDADAIRDAALRAAPGLDHDRLTLSVTRAGARGDPVTVTVGYDVPVATVLAGWLLPDHVHLEAAITARQEFG